MDLLYTVLSSIGGTVVVIGGLSAWLGKVWANRILEKDKRRYQEEIERIKKEFEIHFDGLKAILLRYSENQFNIYSQLWASLCELKLAGDNLWSMASLERVEEFSNQLNKTRFWLEQSSLFIEDQHYETLNRVFSQFENYLFGKENLLELRNSTNITKEEISRITRDVVLGNSGHRQHFTETLRELRGYFKAQISGQKAGGA